MRPKPMPKRRTPNVFGGDNYLPQEGMYGQGTGSFSGKGAGKATKVVPENVLTGRGNECGFSMMGRVLGREMVGNA